MRLVPFGLFLVPVSVSLAKVIDLDSSSWCQFPDLRVVGEGALSKLLDFDDSSLYSPMPGEVTANAVTILFIYFFILAVLSLCCCTQAFSSCGVRASHHDDFSCCRARAQ